jgi:hypothetical protein
VAGILLLIPKTRILGSFMALWVISGAILSHLLFLGIEVQGDGGTLFLLAVTVFVACLFILVARREEAIALVKSVLKK